MYMEEQDTGPSQMCADIQLARAKLGYKPSVSLQEGLKRMVEMDARFQPAQET
jgi:nucleoside-diphosphate-sugar epimerase